MLITKRSMFTGSIRSKELPVTEEQLKAWQDGALIHEAMPHLSVADREFIMTGVTEAEWEQSFPPEE